jgi:hypothetical protein
MKSGIKAAVAAMGLLCAFAPASAAITTWTFGGDCDFGDCSATSSATLTLTDYTKGDALTAANFVSLVYASDAPLSFTIDAANLSYISGRLGGFSFFPGAYSVEISGTDGTGASRFLGTNAMDGISWNASNVDGGFRFGWTTASVPEPASWAMMLGGFGLVGGAMRRRRVTVRFA